MEADIFQGMYHILAVAEGSSILFEFVTQQLYGFTQVFYAVSTLEIK